MGALLLVAASALSACASGESEDEATEPPPPEPPYSIVWSADNADLLTSRSAELVRATYGAAILTQDVGTIRSFPGYEDAVSESRGQIPRTYAWPQPEFQGRGAVPELYRAHILDLESDEDAVRATVCTVRQPTADSRSPSADLDTTSMRVALDTSADLIELRRIPGEDDALKGQTDTQTTKHDPGGTKVPTWNVFEGWRVNSFTNLSPWGEGDPPRPDNPTGCEAWWTQVFPSWAVVDDPSEPDSDYGGYQTDLISPPGTNAYDAATLPQLPPDYPEWIENSGEDA